MHGHSPRQFWPATSPRSHRHWALNSAASSSRTSSDVNPENLRTLAEKFAQEHQLQLPAEVDPDDTLKAAVQADFDLGRQIGLEYVPLIFVIGRGPAQRTSSR